MYIPKNKSYYNLENLDYINVFLNNYKNLKNKRIIRIIIKYYLTTLLIISKILEKIIWLYDSYNIIK